jgi:hypothetical protein
MCTTTVPFGITIRFITAMSHFVRYGVNHLFERDSLVIGVAEDMDEEQV